MKHTKRMLFGILICCLATQVTSLDADVFVLVADLNNGTIYKGSISQGLADLAPLPLSGVIRPVSVDYDPVEDMVYWTDVGQPSPKISKAHLDGSGQMILINELGVPAGLALDIVARMVYWTDENLGHIARIPMDGSGRKEVIVRNINKPRGVITDYDHGHIYWADSGNNGTIERANFDGSNRTVIVEDNMMFPSGLAIDHQENHLYWCDSLLETIERSDLFGDNRKVVIDLTPFNGTFFPFDLVLYNDNVYWSNWGTANLLRVSTSGTGVRNYGPRTFQRAGGIHFYEEFCDSTPCMNGGTCISLTDYFTCQCAPGYGGHVCQFVLGCELSHDASDIVTVDPYQHVYLPGQRVTFRCPVDGYELRGSAVWFCLSDFTWTETQAECIPTDNCGSSPCLNGGSCTSLTTGFICQCAPGYEGNICDFAKRGCSRPPPSTHMTMSETKSFFQPGEEALFTCDNDYVIKGSSDHTIRLVCRAEVGSWSGGETQCVLSDEEAVPSYAPIIGGIGAVTLIVVVLLVILIVIKRKRTRNTDERVIEIPDMQTIYHGGQPNSQFQSDPPPAYNHDQHFPQEPTYSDLDNVTRSHQPQYEEKI